MLKTWPIVHRSSRCTIHQSSPSSVNRISSQLHWLPEGEFRMCFDMYSSRRSKWGRPPTALRGDKKCFMKEIACSLTLTTRPIVHLAARCIMHRSGNLFVMRISIYHSCRQLHCLPGSQSAVTGARNEAVRQKVSATIRSVFRRRHFLKLDTHNGHGIVELRDPHCTRFQNCTRFLPR